MNTNLKETLTSIYNNSEALVKGLAPYNEILTNAGFKNVREQSVSEKIKSAKLVFSISEINSESTSAEIAKLMASNNNLLLLLDQAINALDWYRTEHPEDDSPADDEFRDDCAALLKHMQS